MTALGLIVLALAPAAAVLGILAWRAERASRRLDAALDRSVR